MKHRSSMRMLLATGLTASALFGSELESEQDAKADSDWDASRARVEAFRDVAHALALSHEQQSLVADIFDGLRPQLNIIQRELEAKRRHLQALTPDGCDYETRLEELSAARRALTMQLTRVSGLLRARIFEVLTREQRDRLPELRLAWSLYASINSAA